MDKVLEIYNLPGLNQEKIENINIITNNKIIPNDKKLRTSWLHSILPHIF